MPTSVVDPLLDVAGLHAGYGKIGVLHGVDLRVGRTEIVALLGPNGAGKTTLLRAVSGLLPTTAGTVTFNGRNMRGADPRAAVRAGLAHVIEGHRVRRRDVSFGAADAEESTSTPGLLGIRRLGTADYRDEWMSAGVGTVPPCLLMKSGPN